MKQNIYLVSIAVVLIALGASFMFFGPNTAGIPDLDRPIVFDDSVSEESQRQTAAQVEELAAAIRANNDDFNSWMDLALLRKSVNDFEGAKEAWEYAGVIRPGNALSFLNLGVLHGYYLGDVEKAEENFLLSIENAPKDLQFYGQTFEFYMDVLKDPTRARGIIELALENNPGNVDVTNFLEQLDSEGIK